MASSSKKRAAVLRQKKADGAKRKSSYPYRFIRYTGLGGHSHFKELEHGEDAEAAMVALWATGMVQETRLIEGRCIVTYQKKPNSLLVDGIQVPCPGVH